MEKKGVVRFLFLPKNILSKYLEGIMKELSGERKNYSVIPAVYSYDDLEYVKTSTSQIVIFVLEDALTILDGVNRIKSLNKTILLDMDGLKGFENKKNEIAFLQFAKIDGIVSMDESLIQMAKEQGLLAFQSIPIFNSDSFESARNKVEKDIADAYIISPGWERLTERIVEMTERKIMARGLVCDEESVEKNLKAGAEAVISSNKDLWY